MKILYIGSFDKIWDEEATARGLEANGARVTRLPEVQFKYELYQELVKQCDLLLFAKLKVHNQRRGHIVEYAKLCSKKTACWVPDLYFGLSREYKLEHDPIFKADYVFTPDGGEREWGNVNHHTLRQAIPDQYCFMTEEEDDVRPVIFVGCWNPEYPYRTELLQFIEKRYTGRFRWYGKYDSDEKRGTGLNALYNSAKIVIGDSVYAPHYWSNRIYETLGRGGFLIHPNVPGLSQEYTPYEHFIPYNHGDFDGLSEIIDYYLRDKKRRDTIRTAGYEHTKANHVMSKRCQEFLQLVA